MLQRVQLEHVAARFPSELAELRSFLSATSIPVETPDALPTAVTKLANDRLFRRDLHSHVWAILHDSTQPIHSADLFGIVAVAIAGVDLAIDAQNEHAHDLLRFVMEMRTSLGPKDGLSADLSGRRPPARWIPVARPGRNGKLFRAVAACLILLLGLLLLRKRAPYSWQVAPAVATEAVAVANRPEPTPPHTSSTALPDLAVDQPKQRQGTSLPGHARAKALPATPLDRHLLPSDASAARRSTGEKQESATAAPLQAFSAPPVASLPHSDSPVAAAPVIRRTNPGAIPTSVLSQRLGARSLPYTSAAEEALYYPTEPRLLRRPVKSENSSLLAANEPPNVPGAKRESASTTVGSVRPLSLGTMAANILYSPAPAYPAAAAAARIQGEVKVVAEVDRDGNVASARVISGPPLLREAAVDAVQRWRYRPFVAGGRPVAMSATAVVDFQLE